MFRESLLESSQSIQRKRWPLIAAFIGEVVVAGVLVLIPLLTTGVIHVSAHVAPIVPPTPVHIVPNNPLNSGPGTDATPRSSVVPLADTSRQSWITNNSIRDVDCCEAPDFKWTDRKNSASLPIEMNSSRPVQAGSRHWRVSDPSEARLLKKIEPIYPHIAVLTGKQGDVKLHALIAKDGSIESLTIISGDPLLVNAAVDAVKQWRYRPYLLNGEPVEVETFITVSFKGIRN